MPEYRAYIAGRDGKFIDFVHLNCSDDTEAKKLTLVLAQGRAVELWQLDRKVERSEARD